jgi:hypothetical protein
VSKDLDERLSDAGARWRRTLPAPGEVDVERLSTDRPRRWRVIGLPLAAAAAVLAVVIGLVVAGTSHHSAVRPAVTTSPTPSPSPRPAPKNAIDALVVRDGDTVEAHGTLGQAKDGRLELCSTSGMSFTESPARPSSRAAAPLSPCLSTFFIAYLTGTTSPQVAARVPDPNDDVDVKGVLKGDTVAVTSTTRYVYQDDTPTFPATPCTTPPGGWGHTGDNAKPGHIPGYVNAHPDTYGTVWNSTPAGGPTYKNAEGGYSRPGVLTIGTTLDLATARAALEPLAAGPICIYHESVTLTAMAKARAALVHVYGELSGVGDGLDAVTGTVPKMTPADAAVLSPHAAALKLDAALKPVG